MAASDSSHRTVLGVYVTSRTLEAVLLREGEDGVQVLYRMTRPRLRLGESVKSDDFSSLLPGMKSSEEIDFTLEVGEGRSDVDLDDPVLQSLQNGRTTAKGPALFAAQLREMLAECRSTGYGVPDLAFCVDAPEVAYVDLTIESEIETKEGSAFQTFWEGATGFASGVGAERRILTNALRAKYTEPFDPTRVAFVPMKNTGEGVRYLALVPTVEESVTATLRTVIAADDSLDGVQRLLDAEAALLAQVVGARAPAEPDEHTAVVRVGSSDTLLLFLTGGELRHVERLRSLTTFDPAETICSRVLLHQDEYRLEKITNLVIVGGPRDGRLVEGFESFYDEASIYTLNELLGEEITSETDESRRAVQGTGVALAAALCLLRNPARNLFGATAHAPRHPSMFAWHTVSVMVLLFAVALFFGWRYMDRQQDIADLRQRIALSPVSMPELSPEVLKHRVDSLNAVHARHNRALHVLDSLLVGSDEWSRAIERTAEQTKQIEGIWFDNWSVDPSTITIQGHALKRSNLAVLTRNLGGTIHELKFTDIQGARAYPFKITISRQIEMPNVTVRLREEALAPSEPPVQRASLP